MPAHLPSLRLRPFLLYAAVSLLPACDGNEAFEDDNDDDDGAPCFGLPHESDGECVDVSDQGRDNNAITLVDDVPHLVLADQQLGEGSHVVGYIETGSSGTTRVQIASDNNELENPDKFSKWGWCAAYFDSDNQLQIVERCHVASETTATTLELPNPARGEAITYRFGCWARTADDNQLINGDPKVVLQTMGAESTTQLPDSVVCPQSRDPDQPCGG